MPALTASPWPLSSMMGACSALVRAGPCCKQTKVGLATDRQNLGRKCRQTRQSGQPRPRCCPPALLGTPPGCLAVARHPHLLDLWPLALLRNDELAISARLLRLHQRARTRPIVLRRWSFVAICHSAVALPRCTLPSALARRCSLCAVQTLFYELGHTRTHAETDGLAIGSISCTH